MLRLPWSTHFVVRRRKSDVCRILGASRVILPKLDQDPHLLKRTLESLEQCGPLDILAPHPEEKPQARMTWIRIDAMFADDLVIRGEKCSEWQPIGFRLPFGAANDLIEEANICRIEMVSAHARNSDSSYSEHSLPFLTIIGERWILFGQGAALRGCRRHRKIATYCALVAFGTRSRRDRKIIAESGRPEDPTAVQTTVWR